MPDSTTWFGGYTNILLLPFVWTFVTSVVMFQLWRSRSKSRFLILTIVSIVLGSTILMVDFLLRDVLPPTAGKLLGTLGLAIFFFPRCCSFSLSLNA